MRSRFAAGRLGSPGSSPVPIEAAARPVGVDLRLPCGDDARLDVGELARRVVARVGGLANIGPGGADMALALDRIAFLAVGRYPGSAYRLAVGYSLIDPGRVIHLRRRPLSRHAGFVIFEAAHRLRLGDMAVLGYAAIPDLHGGSRLSAALSPSASCFRALAFPAIENGLGVGRPVDQADLGQAQPGDDPAVGGIARGDPAADRIALVDALDDLVPGAASTILAPR